MIKFLVEIEPEYGESAEELKDLIEEAFLRGLNLYGKVTIVEEE